MVVEPWILKMGNQVSHNLKTALQIEQKKKKPDQKVHKQIIGILSFEVANVMSKTIHLHNSLTDKEVFKLKDEILKSDGVLNLVSTNESYLLELAMAEKLEDLNRVASIVSRLGKKCNEPALHGFRHVYDDLVNGVISVGELGFLVKDMESMVRKMERYVNGTSSLYCEMEVLNELEHAAKKFQLNQHEESRRAFEQKLIWHKQEIRHLKSVSLWNQTYDKVVELLARTICTLYGRIGVVFGESASRRDSFGLSDGGSSIVKVESSKFSGQIDVRNYNQMVSGPLKPSSLAKSYSYNSGSLEKATIEKKGGIVKSKNDLHRREMPLFHAEEFVFPCGTSPGKIFLECLSLTSSASKVDDGDDEVVVQDERCSETSGCCSVNGPTSKRDYPNHSSCFSRSEISVSFNGDQRKSRAFSSTNSSRFSHKSKLCTTLQAPPSTIGGSALSLHYANVIIVIEKLLHYPHLVGEEARDDLYQMLPTSLRMSLKTNLKSYVKNLAIYDAPLAHVWKENLDSILRWLAPFAHNMIRWQSERNFEQQHIVTRTNVLLLQTLHFADRQKTEAAICELLVGLNYICRYEHQQNALMDCASSFDLEDCMEWQMQSSSYHH